MIEHVPAEQVLPLRHRAARDHVDLKPTAHPMSWIGWRHEGRLVAVAGLMDLGTGRFRIRGVWVDPEHRGKGVGTVLTERLLGICAERKGTSVEAYCYNPPFYEARGFKRTGAARPNGAVLVRKDL